jgi:hypothetical protein
MIFFLYIYNYGGGYHPHFGQGGGYHTHFSQGVVQGTISDAYSNHGGHIKKFIKSQGYILKKKFVFK